MLKPSFKSTEGQSLLAVVVGGMVLLYELLNGDASGGLHTEELLRHAETAKDIAAAYRANVNIEGWGTAKVVAVLAFIYKMYGRFSDGRVELKKKELEVNNVP